MGRPGRLRIVGYQALSWGLLGVFAIMLWQNIQMRRQFSMFKAANRTEANNRNRTLSPGDQLQITVRAEGTVASFAAQAARGRSYWWVFDPECPHCRDSAKVLSKLQPDNDSGTQVAALTFAEPEAAARFMNENNLVFPVYEVEKGPVPARLHSTPQFFQVDACGTVIHVYSTDTDFVKAASEH